MTYHVYLYSESNPPGTLAEFDGKLLPAGADQQDASKLLWQALTDAGREKDLGLYRIFPHDEAGNIVLQEKVTAEDWELAQADATFALTDSDNSMLFNAMIAARHTYAIAAKLIHGRLTEATHEDGSKLSPHTFDVFAAVAGEQASRQEPAGLTAVRTLEALNNFIPYLTDFFKSDIAQAQQAHKAAAAAKDQLRREAIIRFGPADDATALKPLSRTRPLAIVGDRDTVLKEIERRVLLALQQTYEKTELPHGQAGVVRLKFADPAHPGIDDAPYAQIGPVARWRSSGRTKKTFAQFLQNDMMPLARNFPTDILVIDDLGKFGNNLLTAGSANPSPVVLADAFKIVFEYTKAIGVGLIVGLPWAGTLPENTVRFLADCEVLRVQPAQSPIITD